MSSESRIAITARGLGKHFATHSGPYAQFRAALRGRPAPAGPHDFWALRDVSFELRAGEATGLIGRNGSGKSTLLQMLAGTLPPSCGEALVHGRVGALLELGSGFNPEFSGRENARLQATLLGCPPGDLARKLADIEAFAEIGAFIDEPVRTYSSGMFVRLAFAVQAVLAPEVLIVDEALAVGDAAFQLKCMSHIRRLLDAGVAVIVASHDVDAVRTLCSNVLWLHQGQVRMHGDPHTVTTAYLRMLFGGDEATSAPTPPPLSPPRPPRLLGAEAPAITSLPATPLLDLATRPDIVRWGNGKARILGARLAPVDDDGTGIGLLLQNGVRLRLEFTFRAERDLSGERLSVAFSLRNPRALQIITFATWDNGHRFGPIAAGSVQRLVFEFDNVLARGEYGLALAVEEVVGVERQYLDFIESAFVVQVQDERPPMSVVSIPVQFATREEPQPKRETP